MPSGGLKRFVQLQLGKVGVRLQGYISEYQAEQRRSYLARVACIHPTANIADCAGFSNFGGNPDNITIGADSALQGELVLFPQGGRITVGQKTFIGQGTRVWSAASVSIGSYVLIAHDVNIHDNNSHPTDWRLRREEIDQILPSLHLIPHAFDLQAKPLVIEDDVWIGFGASILGGVRIGRGSIVGARTMVTKDVPPFALVVGNPMRVVRKFETAERV